jgi:ADP-ribose pyrophosphatase YjhB (NUDIX family)
MPEQTVIQHVSVDAIVAHEGKVLLLHYVALDIYHLPGTLTWPGESLEIRLADHVAEYSNVDITIERPVYVTQWMAHANGADRAVVGIYYACRPENDDFKVETEADLQYDGFTWASPSDLEALKLRPEDRRALQVYFAASPDSL